MPNLHRNRSTQMTELESLQMEYGGLLAAMPFADADFPDGLPAQHRLMLDQMAEIKNSAVTVFDLRERRHVFASYHFEPLFGYEPELMRQHDSAYFDSRIHPADMMELVRRGILCLRFYLELPEADRRPYKYVSEYRVLGRDGAYVRVVEQHQPLLLDSQGQVRFTLSVMDISPQQQHAGGVSSMLIRLTDGALLPYSPEGFGPALPMPPQLTAREAEVLTLIKDGFASKQIAHQLAISVHTVNTHRQRILEKLNASSSAEAVSLAARLGLLS